MPTPRAELEKLSKPEKIRMLKALIDRKSAGTPGVMPNHYNSPHLLTDSALIELIQEYEEG